MSRIAIRPSRSSRSLPFSLAGLLMLLAPTFAAQADTYKIDPVHSAVIFKSLHLNTNYVFGRFNQFGGTINEDSSDPSKTSFEVTVQVDSIDTGNPQRDGHLKSLTFFSAKEFPTITFKSTSVKPSGGKQLEVTGELTLHGKTKPITITSERVGSSNVPQFGQRVGYYSQFKIKRSDFGMSAMPEAIGDEVELFVALEAQKQ
jgi:polyisoprenoid-binding protein YceI